MRKVRAFEKGTNKLVGFMRADEVTSATRHAHDYGCLDAGCSARFYWRDTVYAKQNTEIRDATFAKLPSSQHAEKCRYDFSRFANDHRDVVYATGDVLNVRIGFPLGSAPSDLYPDRPGMLSDAQRRAAHNNVEIQPINNARALVDFLEKHFGGLEDDGLDEMMLHYQGMPYRWSDIFVGSDNYKKLVMAAQKIDDRGRSDAVFTVVKPDHRIKNNEHGKPRFACVTQDARPEKVLAQVTPYLLCADEEMAGHIQRVIDRGEVMVIGARPHVEEHVYGRIISVHLNCVETRQLARVAAEYWRPILAARHQLNFLDTLEHRPGQP